ncbi:entericidin EcnA/B family protein [Kineobactrum sediminis]|uniref:Entericidin EcnA/B family protein n=2 Tax=Kineobactrum sediminis TaxID=1905677 RepID=A0A2N5XYV6_9GAMM|nr:entericidin EcnA/B family protein [Kineobactrum sediminis]
MGGLFSTLSVLALLMLSLTACNTIQGAGEDLERGAEEIQKAAS